MSGVTLQSFEIDQYRGTCTLLGDSREVLDSPTTRNYVIKEAQARGLSRAGLSGAPDVYPVDEKGEPLNPMQAHPGQLKYKGVYKVAGGL